MKIGSEYYLKNFHLYCKDEFFLGKEFYESLLDYPPKNIYSMIKYSLDSNKSLKKVSNRYLQLKFIELLGGEILSYISHLDSIDSFFRIELLKSGMYRDFSIFDKIVLNKSNDDLVREYSALYCSIETSRSLLEDKNQKIRALSFERLGPKESFSFMHRDPSFSIREKAAELSCYNSEESFKLANDNSKKVIFKAINKISLDKVLFLLGNKKIQKDKKLINALKYRLGKYV